MKKWLFNPFFYVAGTRSLLIGWAFMLATALISSYSHAHFDGVIDMHAGLKTPISVYFLEQCIDWASVVVLFYPAALLFSKSKIRFIDVAGTLALARWVTIFQAVISFGISPIPKPLPALSTPDQVMNFMNTYAGTIALSLLMLPFTIWMIALMYNAFRVSCNMKGGKATTVFISVLILAEILAFAADHQLYKHFN